MKLELLDIPTQKINQLKKKDIYSIEELVRVFPRKYYDFRNPRKIDNLIHDDITSVVGTVTNYKDKNRKSYIQVRINDGSRKELMVAWFNQPFMSKSIRIGQKYFIAGKVNINPEYNSIQILNPMIFDYKIDENQKIVPVYSKIKGMSKNYFDNIMNKAINIMVKNDYLEPVFLKKYNIVKLADAITLIHNPKTYNDIQVALKRFLFDDLFLFAMQMYKTQGGNNLSPFKYNSDKKVRELLKDLPFELTNGQSEALKTIYKKMYGEKKIHALVQGDVGAGKTIVAIISMLLTAENGYQSALMSPTTVLAEQHYEEIKELLGKYGVTVDYLSSDLKAKAKREVIKRIKEGTTDIVIGTHSIIQDTVKFKNLALTIVDEEHRFGVHQREKIQEKTSDNVHHISMSATPIPRTLALTLYGNDIDVLTIKTMPNGRKPINTVYVKNPYKTYGGIYRQIKKGRQAYIVCPLIEDSTADVMEDVDSVESTYKEVKKYFKKHPEVKIGVINGKMKADKVSEELRKFHKKEYDIIIATTIIEVGVNVPNTTVILIKNAERFGISQLHQLRGRVGRSSYQSYCVLQSKKENPRIKALTESSDGFVMAQKDLELRGTGDFIGTKQSGDNKYVMLMIDNQKLYASIQEDVSEIYNTPRRLSYYRDVKDKDISDKKEKSG